MSNLIRKHREFGEDILKVVVKWIAENLEPEDVFSEDSLQRWADRNYINEEGF